MNYLQRPTKISTNIRIKNAIVVLFSLLVLTFIAYIGSFFIHRCRDEGNITTLQIEIIDMTIKKVTREKMSSNTVAFKNIRKTPKFRGKTFILAHWS